ncbi:MAG: hypothetical protein JKY67_22180, partial [Pseudomonadales bacterium]|nr:hypothetical protein [Pseudomonadales bacterium]
IHLIGLDWVFVIDLATFSMGVGVLVVATIPAVVSVNKASGEGIFSDIMDAWRYLKSKPALILLLGLTVIVNFNLAAIQVLVIPVVLGFANKAELGMVMSVGGAGVVMGGLIMMAWGGPKRKIFGVLYSALAIASMVVLFPIVPSIYVFAIGAFVTMTMYPIFTACIQSIWQTKVDADMQGRLFSFRSMVIGAVAPIAYMGSGFLADYFFEPLLMEADALSQFMSGWFMWLGHLYGYGAGRGVAVMISLYGVLCFICLLIALTSERIKGIEVDLPDCNNSETEEDIDLGDGGAQPMVHSLA